jgi:uncharacterized membrane protein YfcA
MDVNSILIIAIAALILFVALLYSTVGHGGASGYLAVLALFGMSPVVMKPTALTLNILVAVIASLRFFHAGFFSWRTFWPFAVASIPASFLGGSLTLSVPIYKSIVGVVLIYSAVRLFFDAVSADARKTKSVPIWLALILGAGIGLLSGLTGVGGGIFLSPILLLMGWATTKETSGVAAAFILVNSVAGLVGHFSALAYVPAGITYWAPAALVGGWIGTEIGTRHLPVVGIRRWLSAVLGLAGLKLAGEAILALIR